MQKRAKTSSDIAGEEYLPINTSDSHGTAAIKNLTLHPGNHKAVRIKTDILRQ